VEELFGSARRGGTDPEPSAAVDLVGVQTGGWMVHPRAGRPFTEDLPPDVPEPEAEPAPEPEPEVAPKSGPSDATTEVMTVVPAERPAVGRARVAYPPAAAPVAAPAPVGPALTGPSIAGAPAPPGVASWTAVTGTSPAEWGWRRTVRRLSVGLVKPSAGDGEKRHRAAQFVVGRPFSRPMTVVFANPIGGAGTTVATLLTAATMSAHRGGHVVAWDIHGVGQALGQRAELPPGATVQDLVERLAWLESGHVDRRELGHFLRTQPEAFEVLATAAGRDVAQLSPAHFARVHRLLSRFYRIICIDTGPDPRSPTWQAAMAAADVLVVCTTYDLGVANRAAWMLDTLVATGRADLVENAVVVVSDVDGGVPQPTRDAVIAHFVERTAATVPIPSEKRLRRQRVGFKELPVTTRHAWLYACASMVDGLAIVEGNRK
jgi:MinD-like ATPase involved in chromosome partitioning or flagellar assembly